MIRKPRILVVVIFVMDLIASTKQAPNRGETVIGLNFRTAPGGKGANQAVQCARLGANVTMVGRVGNDAYGRETVAAAAASGVDVSRVVVDAENPTGVSAITLEITETGAHNRICLLYTSRAYGEARQRAHLFGAHVRRVSRTGQIGGGDRHSRLYDLPSDLGGQREGV